jgi:excisionase family DNA binding protein
MSHKAIPDNSDEYCGTSYAAKLLNLSVGTVQTLVEKNELEAWKTQGGHRRISIQSSRDYQNRATISPNANYQDTKRLKVMVVEDDEMTRTMFQMHFDQWDLSLDTTITASAIEALLDISVLKPQVLLTDLRMPGIDGVEMLRQLHTHPLFSQMAVIVITSTKMSMAPYLSTPFIVRSHAAFFTPMPFFFISATHLSYIFFALFVINKI